MKKTLVICGIVYTAMCIGLGTWMMVRPEAYGAWLGKLFGSFTKVLEGGDK